MVSNKQFIDAIFGDAASRVHLACFIEDPTTPDLDRRKWAGGSAAEKLEWAIPSRNNYFTVSVFRPDTDGRQRRRKALFDFMPLVVVDDVDGVKVKSEVAEAMLGVPSYRLETSPGNEQWGYVFDEPITDRYEAEALVDEMIRRGLTVTGNDPGMRGVTRYVRLPVGRNTKGKYGPEGWSTVLREWNPDRRHCPHTMAHRFGIDLKKIAEARRRVHETEMAGLRGNLGDDALLIALRMLGLVKDGSERQDRVLITCPFIDQHTNNDDTGTAYMFGGGGIACHHGHCVNRPRGIYVKRVCDMLGREGTPEAEAAVFNLTSVADCRRSMFNEWVAALLRGKKDMLDKIAQIGLEAGMQRDVALHHAGEMLTKARDRVQQIKDQSSGNYKQEPLIKRVLDKATGKFVLVYPDTSNDEDVM